MAKNTEDYAVKNVYAIQVTIFNNELCINRNSPVKRSIISTLVSEILWKKITEIFVPSIKFSILILSYREVDTRRIILRTHRVEII